MAEEHIVRIKISASDAGVGAVFAGVAAKLAVLHEAVKKLSNSTPDLDARLKKIGTSLGNLVTKLASIPWDLTIRAMSVFGSRIALITAAVAALVVVLGQAAVTLGGALVSAVGQAIPVFGLLAAAFMRVSAAVKASSAAHQEHVNALTNATQIAHDHAEALYNIEQAQVAVSDSTKNLTIVRREATRQLQDLAFAEQQARLQQEEAVFGLLRAQETLKNALRSGDFIAISEARLGVAGAQERSTQADVDARRAAEDNRRAQQLGVENSQQVIQAKRAEAAAIHQLANANYAAAQQTRALTQQSRIAFAQLDPTERKFADAFTKLRDVAKTTFRPLTDAIVSPMTKAVYELIDLLKDPQITAALQQLANEIGKSVTRLTDFLFSKESRQAYILPLLQQATQNLPTVTDILLQVAKALAEVGKAFSGALGGKGGLLESLDKRLQQFNAFLKTIQTAAATTSTPANDLQKGSAVGQRPIDRFVQQGLGQLGGLASLIGSVTHLLQALANLFPASQQAGGPVNTLADAVQKLADVLNDPQTRKNIQDFASALKTIVTSLAGLTQRLKGIFEFFGLSGGGAALAAFITSAAAMKAIAPLLGKLVAVALPGVIAALWALIGKLGIPGLGPRGPRAPGPGGGPPVEEPPIPGAPGPNPRGGLPRGPTTTSTPTRRPARPATPSSEPLAEEPPMIGGGWRGLRGLRGIGGGLGGVATGFALYSFGGMPDTVQLSPQQQAAENARIKAQGPAIGFQKIFARTGVADALNQLFGITGGTTPGRPGAGSYGRYAIGQGVTAQKPSAQQIQDAANKNGIIVTGPDGKLYVPAQWSKPSAEKPATDVGMHAKALSDQQAQAETDRETRRAKAVFTALDQSAKQSEDQASRSAKNVGDTANTAATSAVATYRAGERDTTTGHVNFMNDLSGKIKQGPIGQAWGTVWDALKTTQDTAQQSIASSFQTWLSGLVQSITTSGFQGALANLVTHGGGGGGGGTGDGARFGLDASGNAIGIPVGAFLPGGQDDTSGASVLVGPPSRDQKTNAAIAAAQALDNSNWPYAWGGGHNPEGAPSRGTQPNAITGRYEIGYDCSGSVYAVLRGAGITEFSGNSGDMMTQGVRARGDEDIVVWANRSHAFLTLRGRDFTTSIHNPLDGPGFTPHTHSGFVARKPHGFSRGGLIDGTYDGRDTVPAMLSPGEAVLNPRQIAMLGRDRVMAVLHATGAKVGSRGFATGGVAGRGDLHGVGSGFAFSDIVATLTDFSKDFSKELKAFHEKGKRAIADLTKAIGALVIDLNAMTTAIQEAAQRATTRAQGKVFTVTKAKGGGFAVVRAETQLQAATALFKVDEDERTAILAEQKDANAAIDRLKREIAHAHGKKKKALQDALKGLQNQAKTIQDALDQNTAAIGAQVEEMQNLRLQQIQTAAERGQAAAERLRRLNAVFGKTDNSGVFDQITQTLETERTNLQKLLDQAKASKNTDLVNQLTDQIKDIDVSIAENARAKIQAAVDAINKQAGTILQGTDLDRQLAELGYSVDSRGNLTRTTSGLPDIAGERAALAASLSELNQKRDELQAQLDAATQAGNADLVADLTNQLKQNALAIVENTNATKALTLANLQQFSSSAWQLFRQAAFSGTGGILTTPIPSMDTGGFVAKTGLFMLHAGEKVVKAGDSNQNVQITVNQASPDLDEAALASRLAWEMKVAAQ